MGSKRTAPVIDACPKIVDGTVANSRTEGGAVCNYLYYAAYKPLKHICDTNTREAATK
jgi:hypothetical protein